MSVLILIRHGETDYVGNRLAGHIPGIHLNLHGRQQAEMLAHRLASYPLTAIYSSPLERTVDTAEPLARAHKLPIQILPSLTEINVGDWQGKSIPDLRRLSLWQSVHDDPARFSFPNGESFTDRQKLICTALEKLIRAANSRAVIACVSHGDPIKLALVHFLGLELNYFQRISVDPASASFIYFSGSRIRLGPINLVEEIPLHRPKR